MIKLLHELPLIVGFVTCATANLYLWSRPISQGVLCVIAATLGVLFFAGMMWHVTRDPPESLPSIE